MFIINKNKGLAISLALIFLNACTPPDTGASDDSQTPSIEPKTPIQARQDLMHRWGKANRKLQAMTKDPTNFDVNELQNQIAIIDSSQTQMWVYFDDNALAIANSKVNQLIKENPNDYHAHIESFTTAFDELKHTAHRRQTFDELKPLMDKVNQECKACHKLYKKRR